MKRLILPIILFFLFFTVPVSAAHAQVFKLQLANPSQTINANDTVTVNILINTGGIATINGDALINYDPSKVSIQGAQSGNFFTYFSSNSLGGSTTKYLISSWEESVGHAKTAATDVPFATFTFKALAGGSTPFSLDCTSGTGADSNINQASDSADIINCSALTPLSVIIGNSISTATGTPAPTVTGTIRASVTPVSTSTPVPTSTPKPTSTPRPTITPRAQGPVAGSAGVTVAIAGLGTLLTVIGILAIL